MVIQQIDILHLNGKQLLTRRFKHLEVNKQAFNDFLLSLNNFAKNICHAQIKHVKLNRFQVFIEIHEPFILAIIFDRDNISNFLLETIKLVIQQFNVECYLQDRKLLTQRQFIIKFDGYLGNLYHQSMNPGMNSGSYVRV